MNLNTAPNLSRPDDFYEALIEMHRGLDDDASQAVNARLILLLCNHIGGHDVLLDAMRSARAGVAAPLAEAA
ncbi:hypothetical protein ABIC71_001234 [Herbaspirillum seropedicae]|jgi:hypothetical protein|uniref:DUF2783 domain-containing protein n=1 Tax=Herbaspirillum seropedicae TaxID=964 RepID=UPI003391E59F